jgi:hypothetical protein
MNKLVSICIIIAQFFLMSNALAQKKQTYESNGTTYIQGESYTSTGKPKVERSSSARNTFLKTRGLENVPPGYQVDHIVPLSEGGLDTPSNMQLISTEQHKRKTANERAKNSNSTYIKSSYRTSSTSKNPNYKSNSTYKSSYSYSTPTYSGSSKVMYAGPRGGQYYINSNGNKTYVKKK